MRRQQGTIDDCILSWQAPDATTELPGGVAVPVDVSVTPVRPGHALVIEYRLDRGPVREVLAEAMPRQAGLNARVYRALIPALSPAQTGARCVEYLPVLRLGGQYLSPRLSDTSANSSYRLADSQHPVAAPLTSLGSAAAQARWDWDQQFLGTLTVGLRKEVVGPTPDGLRINWHLTEGVFIGPGLLAHVLPGGADWMRIRPDGVGIVDVTATLQTSTGARIFANYGGRFDLGPDGYVRALRDEFDPLPPLVVAPTYATADKQLEWLNRAQCMGVGRVDLKNLQVEVDIYLLRVGGRLPALGVGKS